MLALGLHLGGALLDGCDLRGGVVLAGLPLVALGGDSLHAAVGEFSLAGERLRFGAHLCGTLALLVHRAARSGELCFRLVARGQFGDGLCRDGVSAIGFGTVGGKAGLRFRERGAARGVAVDLALGGRMAITRGIGITLCCTGGFARGGLGGSGEFQFGLGGFQRLPLGARIDAGLFNFVLDVGETSAFG